MYTGFTEKIKQSDAIQIKELFLVKLVKKQTSAQNYFKEYSEISN